MMGFGYGMFGLGMLLMIAFWVLVIGGAVWLVMRLTRGNQPQASTLPSSNQTPLDILKLRYAKGEITQEQFEQMKRDLGV